MLAPDGGDDDERIERAFDSWPDDGSSRAVLARTNVELVPAAAVAVEHGIAFRANSVRLPVEEPALDAILAAVVRESAAQPGLPLLVVIEQVRADLLETDSIAACGAILGWAPRYETALDLVAAVDQWRQRLAGLRDESARLSLATAHAVKGLEFDHVLVLMDADRFPSRRALDDASDPARALEEERRLAYVAWTRARRSLTLLYDPAAPSPFLLEAFDRRELG